MLAIAVTLLWLQDDVQSTPTRDEAPSPSVSQSQSLPSTPTEVDPQQPSSDHQRSDDAVVDSDQGHVADQTIDEYAGRLSDDLIGDAAERAKILAAAQTGTRLDRISDHFRAPAFDRERYRADPDGYCRAIVPGRIWLTATPGKDVPALQPVGHVGFDLARGASVVLRARAVPSAPVTFLSANLGAFANGADVQTVATGSDGIASVTFTATDGTIDYVSITAACPLTSGQVVYSIRVLPAR